jgi:hypothetical protein
MKPTDLPIPLIALGLAGITPQAICLGTAMAWPDFRWFALSAGCCYAAVILSFLGGLWWMAALVGKEQNAASYIVAVVPSLVGWGAMLPWCFGWAWPAPSLIVLGFCLLASPLVDRALPSAPSLPPVWLRLRVAMASGLGIITLALALMAPSF